MKILKYLGLGVGTVVAIVIIVIAARSPKTHMERSLVINASPAAIYERLINLKDFNTWSPWAALDPNTKYTFEGPESGPGAKMSWVSENPNVGTGSQWIAEAEAGRRIKNGMQFGDFEGVYFAEFVLEPVDGGTKVTWTYDGDVSGTSMMNAAAGKFFGMFMDSMLGPTYEQGLENLKTAVESAPAASPAPDSPPADSVVAK